MAMSYLIDTHILLWWVFNDPKLNTECRNIILNPDNNIIVSSASAWEIATKYHLGKLPSVQEYLQILHQAKFVELPITTAHALRAGSLAIAHQDPFDRMIMAQAEIENLPVITYDKAFQTGLIQIIPAIS